MPPGSIRVAVQRHSTGGVVVYRFVTTLLGGSGTVHFRTTGIHYTRNTNAIKLLRISRFDPPVRKK